MKPYLIIYLILIRVLPALAQEQFLDPSFGTQGRANITFFKGDLTASPGGMVIESDGDLFVSGNVSNAIDPSKIMGGFALLNSKGKIDSSVLINGVQPFDLNIRPVENINPSKLVINTQGSIYTLVFQGKTPFSNQLRLGNLARAYNFNPNFNAGQLVNIFSQSEKDSFIVFNHQFKVQKNDQLLISYRKQSIPKVSASNIITRYNADGSLDKAFGNQGRIVVDSNALNRQLTSSGVISNYDFFETAQNKILLVGDSVVVSNTGNTSFIKLIRFLPNGSPDQTFGKDGVIRLSALNLTFRAAVLDQNDNLYVAGLLAPNVVLLKIKPTGVMDSSFGTKGMVTLDKALNVSRIVLNSQQEPIVAGFTVLPNNNTQVQLLYFKSNGTIHSFGVNGKVTIPLKAPFNSITEVKTLADGSVVVLIRNVLNDAGNQTAIEVVKIKSSITTPLNATSTETKKISIYPNPVADRITIKSDASCTQSVLYALDGRYIQSINHIENNVVTIPSLPSGTYLIRCFHGKSEMGTCIFSKY
jgi:uncharacterized delta-60 repeat protein